MRSGSGRMSQWYTTTVLGLESYWHYQLIYARAI